MKDIDYISSALADLAGDAWADRPVIFPSPTRGWADELFGIDVLKWMLVGARIPEGCFRVIKNGEFQPHAAYSRPIVVGAKPATYVLDGMKASMALKDGDSLILSALEEYLSPVSTLCKSLGKQLGTKCSAFAVVTPPGSRGLVPHIDRTEQLVIQCQGSKLWNVFDIYTRGNRGLAVDLEIAGDPILEEEITEGQMLYLPQGAPHMAHSTDVLSAHITLTFEHVTMGNWIEAALSELIEADNSCLTSLPPYYHENPEACLEKLELKCREIVSKLDVKSKQVASEELERVRDTVNQ